MTSPDQSALVMLKNLLAQWGLESLSGVVSDMLVAGDSADVIPFKLRDTKEYQERFKGNLERRAKGLPVLTEAEYLSTETALKSQVRRFLGTGVYDTKDNLDKWMAADLSPQELSDRLGLYQRRYLQQPQSIRDAWAGLGYTPADALRVMIDPTVDETKIKRAADIYGLGAAAWESYGTIPVQRLADLVDRGVDVDRARGAFSAVASRAEHEDLLARMAGAELTREDQENAEFFDDQVVQARRSRVIETERGRFAENYLGGRGAVGRSTSGSY